MGEATHVGPLLGQVIGTHRTGNGLPTHQRKGRRTMNSDNSGAVTMPPSRGAAHDFTAGT